MRGAAAAAAAGGTHSPRISSALPKPRVTPTPQQLCYLIFEFSLFLSCAKGHVTPILLHRVCCTAQGSCTSMHLQPLLPARARSPRHPGCG
jgi:hypothetical protein